MTVLTNVPTVGADIGTWGAELNDALSQLDTGKADASTVYTKTAADARFVRTVNGTGPDATGNVAVAGGGGGGGTGTVTKVNGVSPDGTGNVTLTAASVGARPTGVNIVAATEITGLSGVALSGDYNALNNKPAASVPLASVNQPNGVAGLDGTSKVPVAQMPAGFGGTTLLIVQNGDLTWPARTLKTTDRTVPVFWQGLLPGPTIGTAANTAVASIDKMIVLG